MSMVQFGLYNGNLFGRIVVGPDEKGLPIRKIITLSFSP